MIIFPVFAIPLWEIKQTYGERLNAAIKPRNLKQSDIAKEFNNYPDSRLKIYQWNPIP